MGYEDLLIECAKDGLNVKEKPLRATNGLCCGNRIAIKDNLTFKEKYCVLSEEYGHYKTTYGDILNQKDIKNKKQELKARRWGYEKICGLDKISDAILKGAEDRYEIAEYLNVTDEFFEEAIKYLKLKHGYSAYCKGIYYIFEPNFGIIKKL